MQVRQLMLFSIFIAQYICWSWSYLNIFYKICLHCFPFQESGHSGSQADALPVHPSHLAHFYWEARAQGFHGMRGKLLTEERLRRLFNEIENVNITFSTWGCDSYLDRWGYILNGPLSDMSCDHNLHNPSLISKHRYQMMLKNLEYVSFDLQKDCKHLMWLCQ